VIEGSVYPRAGPLRLPGIASAGSFAAEALQERRKQVSKALLVIRSRVYFSLWRKFVDDLRQILGQEMRGLCWIDAYFCRECIHLLRAKHFLDLVGGNWMVFRQAHPRGERVTFAALREFVRQALQSPALREKAAKNPNERIRSARRITFSGHRTEYRVE
jgi:hypothetical protein